MNIGGLLISENDYDRMRVILLPNGKHVRRC